VKNKKNSIIYLIVIQDYGADTLTHRSGLWLRFWFHTQCLHLGYRWRRRRWRRWWWWWWWRRRL
jgi:hypothetical protein